MLYYTIYNGLLLVVRNPPARAGDARFDPWVGKIPWRRPWQPTPVFLLGESPGTEEPGRWRSMESQRVIHDWSGLARMHAHKLYYIIYIMFSSVHFSSSVLSDSLRPHGLHHARLPCPSPTPGVPSPSPPAFNLSQHQGLFKWVSSLHQVAKVLEFQLQPQSFQWIVRTDLL